MKGVILAGGSGTRLYPATKVVNKHLLAVYNRPLIYFPLCTLFEIGIREILIISTPSGTTQMRALLGCGESFGVKIEYEIQEKANGIAESLIIAEDFLSGENCCLILADNIFCGPSTKLISEQTKQFSSGARLFLKEVPDPNRYGVAEVTNGRVVGIEEKPKAPKSNLAATGLYFYDRNAAKFAKELTPSPRGELEITDLNKMYLQRNELSAFNLSKDDYWNDAGTADSMLEISTVVKNEIEHGNKKIGNPELTALNAGYINEEEYLRIRSSMPKSAEY